MTSHLLNLQAWDSPMFISLIYGKHPERVPIIRDLLALEAKRKITIVVSSFAQAEIRPYIEGEENPPDLDPAEWKAVQDLFRSGRLDYRVLTPAIAEKAAEIGRMYPRLLAGDCVHIATAISAGADVLFTFDGAGKRRRPRQMITHSGQIGKPPLRICEPFVPMGELFDREKLSGASASADDE